MTPISSLNKVRLLTDTAHAGTPQQDIFVQVNRLLSEATHSIRVEMYNLDEPEVVDKLVHKCISGVPVEVILDPPRDEIRDAGKIEAMRRLRAAGATVHTYPVKPLWDPEATFGQLDHVKLLIVDGRRALIGGMNWGAHSRWNHDYDVLVEGPAVVDMLRFFRQDWQESGGTTVAGPLPAVPGAGDCPVNLVTSSLQERSVGDAVAHAIDSATQSIHVEQFVLTEPETVRRLKQAHARGVDVRVLLHPFQIGDKKLNEAAAEELQAAGIPVRWYRWSPVHLDKLHAKAAVFDHRQVILGSANWSGAGFHTNREADVDVVSPEVGASLERQFTRDWAASTPIPWYPAPEGV